MSLSNQLTLEDFTQTDFFVDKTSMADVEEQALKLTAANLEPEFLPMPSDLRRFVKYSSIEREDRSISASEIYKGFTLVYHRGEQPADKWSVTEVRINSHTIWLDFGDKECRLEFPRHYNKRNKFITEVKQVIREYIDKAHGIDDSNRWENV